MVPLEFDFCDLTTLNWEKLTKVYVSYGICVDYLIKVLYKSKNYNDRLYETFSKLDLGFSTRGKSANL